MKKIAVLFGNKGGNTEYAAQKISELLQADLLFLNDIIIKDLEKYDLLVMGMPTVGSHTWESAQGGHLWSKFFKELKMLESKNKKAALFGLGDQILYPGNFVDSMGMAYNELISMNFTLIGEWPLSGYTFEESAAVRNGKFVGLALDEDWQSELTKQRIGLWVKQLQSEI